MLQSKTAILIFANSAQVDGIAKPFKSSSAVFEHLNNHVLKKVKQTGLPFVLSTENDQIGNTFGERFTNAIQKVYDLGFENIITIGNDSPQLKTSQLLKTAHYLETEDIVLGPSKDGGFYLMGLKKTCFNRQTLLKLPWQTSRLVKSISTLIVKSKIRLHTLPVLADIDTLSDLKAVLSSFKTLPIQLKQLLVSLLKEINSIRTNFNILISFFFLNNPFNKGSPAVFLS